MKKKKLDLVIEYSGPEETNPLENTIYCRSLSKPRIDLENAILKLYQLNKKDGYDCKIFSSGTNAIFSLFLNCSIEKTQFKKFKQHVFIIGNELYSGTKKVTRHITDLRNKGVIFEEVDIKNFDSILKIFAKYDNEITLCFFESCTNPSGDVIDFDRLNELKILNKDLVICIDNTWCSAFGLNPFFSNDTCSVFGLNPIFPKKDREKSSVTLVLESVTKYLSGGKCIGGFICGENKIMKDLSKLISSMGIFVGADHCELFLQGILTLKERMIKTSKIAEFVAEFLEDKAWYDLIQCPNQIKDFFYPTFVSHRNYQINSKYLLLHPGIIWFSFPLVCKICILRTNLIKTEIAKYIVEYLKDSDILKFETSYGASYSKIDPWFKVDIEQNGIQKPTSILLWLRLSIGYETNPDSLVHILTKLIFDLQTKISFLNNE